MQLIMLNARKWIKECPITGMLSGTYFFYSLNLKSADSKINEFEHWTVVVSLSSRSNMGRSCLLISKTT